MKRINLTQISEKNTILNTTSISKFKQKVYELQCNINEIIETGLISNFNDIKFNEEVKKLKYFTEYMYVMNDEDYEKFEDSICKELDEFFILKKSKS